MPWRYEDLRALHAMRRENEAFIARVSQLSGVPIEAIEEEEMKEAA
jgi:hypothetical protein